MVPLLAVQGEADPRDQSSVASCSAYLGPGQVWESWPCIRTNSVRDQLKTNSVRDQLKRLIVPLWLWEKQIPMIPFCCWLWFVCLGWHLKVYFSLKKIELCLLSFSLLKYHIVLLDRNKASYSLNPPHGSPAWRRCSHCPGGSFVSWFPCPSHSHPAITIEYVNISMDLQ